MIYGPYQEFVALYSLSMYAPDVIASTPIINDVGNDALAFATSPMAANSMAFQIWYSI